MPASAIQDDFLCPVHLLLKARFLVHLIVAVNILTPSHLSSGSSFHHLWWMSLDMPLSGWVWTPLMAAAPLSCRAYLSHHHTTSIQSSIIIHHSWLLVECCVVIFLFLAKDIGDYHDCRLVQLLWSGSWLHLLRTGRYNNCHIHWPQKPLALHQQLWQRGSRLSPSASSQWDHCGLKQIPHLGRQLHDIACINGRKM